MHLACKCPFCGIIRDGFGYNGNKLQCPNCDQTFEKDRMVTIEVETGNCICGNSIPLLADLKNGDFYFCNECDDIAFTEIDGNVWKKNELLDFKKTGNNVSEWIKIDDNLICSFSQNEWARKICSAMIFIAQNENSEFSSLKDWGKVSILTNNKQFLGYIVWFETKMARLNQIYILPNQRKNGYAKEFLKFWVENIADKTNDRFEVESPNKAAVKLLLKLDYLIREKDEILDGKCIIIGSPGYAFPCIDD